MQSFDQNLLPEERFSPHDLIRKVEEQKEELGLIIDLTYTTRYYGREVSAQKLGDLPQKREAGRAWNPLAGAEVKPCRPGGVSDRVSNPHILSELAQVWGCC